jgi:hypothetical protein
VIVKILKWLLFVTVAYFGFDSLFVLIFIRLFEFITGDGLSHEVAINIFALSRFLAIIAVIILIISYRNAKKRIYIMNKSGGVSKFKKILAIIFTLGTVLFIYYKYKDEQMMKRVRERHYANSRNDSTL